MWPLAAWRNFDRFKTQSCLRLSARKLWAGLQRLVKCHRLNAFVFRFHTPNHWKLVSSAKKNRFKRSKSAQVLYHKLCSDVQVANDHLLWGCGMKEERLTVIQLSIVSISISNTFFRHSCFH